MTAKLVCILSLVGLAVLMIVGPRLDQAGQVSAMCLTGLLSIIAIIAIVTWGLEI